MVSSTDHITPVTGLTPVVTISKNGATFASPAGAVTEVGSGWYKVAGNATDTGTTGPLVLHATGAGSDPCDDRFEVVAFNPDDATRLGITALPNAAAAASGGLPILGTNATAISFTGGMTISSSTGTALALTSSGGNGSGLAATGNGTGHGMSLTGGATGNGLNAAGGATSGHGINVSATGAAKNGINITAAGATGNGIFASGGTAGNGMSLTAGSSGGSGLLLTGGASGFGLSTTGLYGFNLGGNTYGVYCNGPAMYTKSLTIQGTAGNAALTLQGGNASGATPAGDGLVAIGGAASTTSGGVAGRGFELVGGAGAASTNGAGDAFYATGGGTTTVSGGAGMSLVHTGSAYDFDATTTPLSVGGGGGGSDPWLTTLPGSYTAGSAGYILGTYLDAAISSRSTYAGGDTSGTTTLLTRIPSNLAISSGGVTVAGYATGQDPATLTLATPANKLATDVSGRVTVGTNADKTGYSLSQAFPANFSSLSVDASGRVDVGKILGTTSAGVAGYVGIDWSHVNAPTTALALTNTTISSGQQVDLNTIKTQAVTAAAGVTFPASIGTSTLTAANVWDLATTGHTTAGTFGAAVVAAGSAGDPWATSLPGAYSVGTAGYILGTNLNATVSSRSTYAGGDTSGVTTLLTRLPSTLTVTGGGVTVAGYSASQDPASYVLATPANKLTTDLSGRVTVGSNADKTGYTLTQTFPTNFATLSIDGTGRVTVGTNADKTGYSLTQTFPANFASLSVDVSGRVDVGKILGTASAGAAGYVGIDWSHVNAPTSPLALTNTTIAPVSVSGTPSVNVTQIAGQTASAAAPVTFPASIGTSTYAGADTPGTTTLLGRVSAPVALAGTAPAWYSTAPDSTAVAGAVWNALTANYNSLGTFGHALQGISAAADPWTTSLPGSYAPGTAGHIIGNQLDVAVSSRMPDGATVEATLVASALDSIAVASGLGSRFTDENGQPLGTMNLRQAVSALLAVLIGDRVGVGTREITAQIPGDPTKVTADRVSKSVIQSTVQVRS